MTVKKKTYSSGESLAELLVAVLIISLAMIMLFSGTKAGTGVMVKNRDKYQQYYSDFNDNEKAQAEYVVEYNNLYPHTSAFSFSINPHK